MAKKNNPRPPAQSPSPPLDLKKVTDAVQSTGFNLEHQVSEQFRKAGWSVINNKYYVDDTANSVREIDLIAYKVGTVGCMKVYTTLIVSCKKSEQNAWALLCKPPRVNDPNIDWHPQHAWSNHPQLDYMLTKTDWVQDFIGICKRQSIYNSLIAPQRHIFAFQEIDKIKYKCQNDSHIFNSISSLMKAQGYEIGALKLRKREPVVYMFGLITVVDTELVRVDYSSDGSTTAELIDDDRYIGSYIINQKEIAARIHFVTAKAFPKLIAEYDKLHFCNGSVVAELEDKFYEKVIADDERAQILDEAFSRVIAPALDNILYKQKNGDYANRKYKARLNWEGPPAAVYGPSNVEDATILNESSRAQEIAKKALESIYRYKGPWRFEEEIPF